jgi:hypothetical protein
VAAAVDFGMAAAVEQADYCILAASHLARIKT